jgi:YggT family protein
MRLLATLLDGYSLVVLAAVVMSWAQVGRRHPLARLVYDLTEPALAPLRRLLPAVGGLDFSPMVLLLILRALRDLA